VTVYSIDISSDIEEVLRNVTDFMDKDIPYTVASAINSTAFDVRRRVSGTTFDKAFNVRNKAFPRALWAVDTIRTGGGGQSQNMTMGTSNFGFRQFKSGEIDTMRAMVRQKLPRDYIVDHTQGGTKLPSGSSIAIPANGGAGLRTKTGRISATKKPRRITNKSDHFLARDKSGRKRFIARRDGKGIDVVYRFRQSANIKPRFRFYQDAFDTVDRVMLRHWGHQVARVVNRSRFTNR